MKIEERIRQVDVAMEAASVSSMNALMRCELVILGRLRPQIELHSRPISWSCPNCNLSSTFSHYRLFAVFASSISAVVNPSIPLSSKPPRLIFVGRCSAINSACTRNYEIVRLVSKDKDLDIV
jgi:hypothetical protein